MLADVNGHGGEDPLGVQICHGGNGYRSLNDGVRQCAQMYDLAITNTPFDSTTKRNHIPEWAQDGNYRRGEVV